MSIVLLSLSWGLIWSDSDFRYKSLSSDGRGYYAYLPAFFIHGDPTFQSSLRAEEEQFQHWKNNTYLYQNQEGRWYNKYYPGVALMVLPFFLVAWFLSLFFEDSVTGYESVFLISFHLATICYATLGFFFSRKLVETFGFSRARSILIAGLVLFGTNLIFYSSVSLSLSHAYSFCAIALFLLLLRRFAQDPRLARVFFGAAVLGLIFLIRPTNVTVALLIPFCLSYNSDADKSYRLLLSKRGILTSLSGFFSVSSILMLLNAVQTGDPLNWSYHGEGFYFFQPEIANVLFSFRRGWFLWTPLAFIAMLGFVPLWRKNRLVFLSGLLYLLLTIYLISSWWNWYYGDGFGHRAFIDSYAFIAVLLAFASDSIRGSSVRFLWGAIVLCVCLNLYQAYQAISGIIPLEYMTSDMYVKSLSMYHPKYAGEFAGFNDIKPYGEVVFKDRLKVTDEFQFNSSDEFGAAIEYEIPELQENQQVYLEWELSKYRLDEEPFQETRLVTELRDATGESMGYWPIYLYNHSKEAEQSWVDLQFSLHLIKERKGTLKTYIWNKGKCSFIVKDMHFTLSVIESGGPVD